MDRTLFPFSVFYSLIIIFILLLLFGLLLDCSSSAADNNSTSSTITRTQNITDRQSIVSSGKTFKLGFFKAGTSSNSYLGIWYNNIPVLTYVWVANRDDPIADSSGVARIADDGNLEILVGNGISIWSTNVSNIPVVNSSSSVIAELLDSGNLVLRQQTGDRKILWQSFDFPTDTLLPTMKIGVNRKTGKNIQLTSWNNSFDPSMGKYSLGVDLTEISFIQLITYNGSRRLRRSGPWSDNKFLGTYFEGLSVIRDTQEDSVYVIYNDTWAYSSLGRLVLDHSGEYREEIWTASSLSWETYGVSTGGGCNNYNRCGRNRICGNLLSRCACLHGYEVEGPSEDGLRSSGCVRVKEFQCEINRNSSSSNSSSEARDAKDADEFIEIDYTLPDFPNRLTGPNNTETCEDECQKNCSCIAYSYANDIGCMTWGGDLIDMAAEGDYHQVTLYLRRIPLESTTPLNLKDTIIISVVIGTFVIIVCTYFWWRWRAKQRGKDRESIEIPINADNINSSDSDMLGDNIDLKVFKFEDVVTATNNFCETNKLGEGGFGPVYKGTFVDDGQEIAVKRLSKCSLQGFQEFKNEVLVILKLQHRNLVRLLGCCMEGEERLLIYEYMPNKSLDAFIFDSKKQALLDWRKRFQIIEGISRGIIYLHRDSRLRVIHRDLKASNILLDEELNPKISDFGMARIFGSNELQANTRRVVGTYGYMSPEYAMDGLFSEKSDVFSFGVLLLEIVSGKRNTSFYNHELSSSLLGYAWKLWNDNQIQLLIDPTLLYQPDSELEILRCIHVGLLCVQEFASDRPTMYTALSMLISEISSLPTPKQPAFTEKRVSSDSNPSQINACSLNDLTISKVVGR